MKNCSTNNKKLTNKKLSSKKELTYIKPTLVSEKMFERAALACLKCDFGGAVDPAVCTTLTVSTS